MKNWEKPVQELCKGEPIYLGNYLQKHGVHVCL